MTEYITCPKTGHRVYLFKGDAQASAKAMSKSKNYDGKFKVYRCRGCKTYHIKKK